MPNRPLLAFPIPTYAQRSSRGGGPEQALHLPGHGRQGRRLTPKFSELQRSAMDLQDDPSGAAPEQVVVFETVGPVDNFLTAVRHTQGMSWLADLTEEEIPADENFHFEKPERRHESLSGRLYLVIANQQAIEQLLSLWRKYKRDPKSKFDRGLNAWKVLFAHLKDVRRWSSKDRLEETGILENWREQQEHNVDPIRFEAELWCRESAPEQQNSFERFRRVVEEQSGRCIAQSCIPEIA